MHHWEWPICNLYVLQDLTLHLALCQILHEIYDTQNHNRHILQKRFYSMIFAKQEFEFQFPHPTL